MLVLFKSNKSEVIREDGNKIDYISSQHYSNEQIIQLVELTFETVY